MKNVTGSQPCISMNFVLNSVKYKFFHVCIVKENFPWKSKWSNLNNWNYYIWICTKILLVSVFFEFSLSNWSQLQNKLDFFFFSAKFSTLERLLWNPLSLQPLVSSNRSYIPEKGHTYLKKVIHTLTCNWKLRVYLSVYNSLVDTRR